MSTEPSPGLKKSMVRTLKTLLALAAVYLLILAAPYPLFAYHASYGNITVYSDRPIPSQITPILV